MSKPERSVEVIEHYSGDELTTLFIQGEEWVPIQTLQAERQKREEMVEAERERISLIVRSIDFEVRQTDTRVEAAIWQSIKNLKEAVLQALTQPNNPK